MNILWSLMIIVALIIAAATGNMEQTLNAVFEGADTAVSTLLSFAGAMCFWTGIMKVAEKSGVSNVICRIISPIVSRLFPGSSKRAREYISMNITANLLGMGNAATPMGMLAAETLDKENPCPEKPSKNLCMLVVLNTASVQLVPSTIIALRAAVGSQNPASIIFPIWIVSVFSVFVGIITLNFYYRFISSG